MTEAKQTKKRLTRDEADGLVRRTLSFAPKTLNEDERSVEVTMTTETPVRMYFGDEILLMKGAKVGSQVPLLDSHDRGTVDNVIGSVRNIRIDGDAMVGRAYFAKDEKSFAAWQKVRQGHLTDFSIGYRSSDYEMVEAGESGIVDGKEYRASEQNDLYVVRAWELKELSAVPIGADPLAKVRADSQETTERKEKKMAETVTAPSAAPNAEPKVPAVDVNAERAAAAQAERKRIQDITAEARDIEGAEEIVRSGIEKGLGVDEVRAQLLALVRGKIGAKPGPIDRAPEKREEDMTPAIQAAFLLRSGHDEKSVLRECGQKAVEQSVMARRWGFQDLCRYILQSEGKHVPHSKEDLARASFSTYTLPKMLGAVANKSALMGYTEQPETWSRWCKIIEIPNLQTQTLARFADQFTLDLVPQGGELTHTQATEEYEQMVPKTYGKMFQITRTDIINDDLRGFTEVPAAFGRAAASNVSDQVYTLFLANGTLTSSYALMGTDNDNYISGTDTVLNATYGVGALDLAMAKFLKMKNKAGRYLNVTPRFLLVPPDIATMAMSLYKSETVVSGTTNRVPVANIYAGMFETIVEPRCAASTYTGYSTTAWYLLADPNQIATTTVGFLPGLRNPTVEKVDVAPDVLGIAYRVYHDFGVCNTDYRGVVKSKGAS